MPAGARRSLASPVVSGVLCQCGGGAGAAATSTPAACGQLPAAEAGEGSSPPCFPEHERRVHSLFLQLDVNRDGALCVHDLAVGLGRLGLHRSERDLRVSRSGEAGGEGGGGRAAAWRGVPAGVDSSSCLYLRSSLDGLRMSLSPAYVALMNSEFSPGL